MIVVVVVIDSDIQRIALATEETTVTQQVSHVPIKCQSRSWSQVVRRSAGHIMVTARYLNQQGSKSRQKPCQVQPTENIGNVSSPNYTSNADEEI